MTDFGRSHDLDAHVEEGDARSLHLPDGLLQRWKNDLIDDDGTMDDIPWLS
jgi:hypothetical protein